jgi:GAF domain-containing protein
MTDTWSDVWPQFLAALAAPEQPRSVFAALQAIFRARAPARLFTVMAYDAATRLARRAHTSHPPEYPLSGEKPLPVGLWSRTVIDEKRPFVANTIEEIAMVFQDFELIRSLGCESAVNLPVVFAGGVIGTVNLLDARGAYPPDRVAEIERLAPFAATALLAARSVGV